MHSVPTSLERLITSVFLIKRTILHVKMPICFLWFSCHLHQYPLNSIWVTPLSTCPSLSFLKPIQGRAWLLAQLTSAQRPPPMTWNLWGFSVPWKPICIFVLIFSLPHSDLQSRGPSPFVYWTTSNINPLKSQGHQHIQVFKTQALSGTPGVPQLLLLAFAAWLPQAWDDVLCKLGSFLLPLSDPRYDWGTGGDALYLDFQDGFQIVLNNTPLIGWK